MSQFKVIEENITILDNIIKRIRNESNIIEDKVKEIDRNNKQSMELININTECLKKIEEQVAIFKLT